MSNPIPKVKDIIKPEEREQMLDFVQEAQNKSNEILLLFDRGTRGLMLFALTMDILRKKHPGIVEDGASAVVAEWFAAGQPESLSDVPKRIIERALEDMNENQRPN